MIYKNKELLMQTCNILRKSFYYYDDILFARRMYDYLVNCGTEDWQTYYKNNVDERRDKYVRKEYKQLIRSLNNFNRFKV